MLWRYRLFWRNDLTVFEDMHIEHMFMYVQINNVLKVQKINFKLAKYFIPEALLHS